jgi:hypothetical protein
MYQCSRHRKYREQWTEAELLNFYGARESQGINSASLCSLAGRYDNYIPTRFQVPIDCLKIPALNQSYVARHKSGALYKLRDRTRHGTLLKL